MEVSYRQMTTDERVSADPEMAMQAAQRAPAFDRLVASIRVTNSLPAYRADNWTRSWKAKYTPQRTDDYNAIDDIPSDLMRHVDVLWDAPNKIELNRRIQSLTFEDKNKQLMAQGGAASVIGMVIGTLGSPEFLPGLFWTPAGGGLIKTGVRLGLYTAAEEALHMELIDSQTVAQINPYEKLMSIGVAGTVGAILGGAIGGFSSLSLARRGSKEITAEYREIAYNNGVRQTDRIADEVPTVAQTRQLGKPASAGAAEVDEVLNAPIRAPRWKSGVISALRPLMKARSPVVQKYLNKIFGHDNQIRYNEKPVYKQDKTGELVLDEKGDPIQIGVEHIAKEPSIERLVDQEVYAKNGLAMNTIYDGFKEYVRHVGRSVTMARMKNRGELQNYYKHLRYAMSNDDEITAASGLGAHQIEAINRTAKTLRTEIYDPIDKLARQLGEIDKGTKAKLTQQVRFAEQMVSRSKDPSKIQKWKTARDKAQSELDQFDEMVTQVKFAISYANRRFNAVQIENDETAFKQVAFDHFYAARVDAAYAKAREVVEDEIDVLRKASVEGETEKLIRLETKLANLKRSDFEITDKQILNEIYASVEDTFNKIVAGDYDSAVFMRPGQARNLKERVLPIPDNVLLENNWLHTDMIDQIKGYLNSTLRPLRMKEVFDDTELTGVLGDIAEDYKRMIREANQRGAGVEEAKSLRAEHHQVRAAFEVGRDRFYGRTQLSNEAWASVSNYARSIRNLNIMRMMGGVLLTSLSDIARLRLAKIWTPELKGVMPGLIAAFRTAAKNKAAFMDLGIGGEQAMMIRTSRMVDMAEPQARGSARSKALLNMSRKGAMGLMKATFLVQWTDHMKTLAAAWTQNTLVRMMANYGKLSTRNKTILAELGIDQDMAARIMGKEGFAKYGERHGKTATTLNLQDWTDEIAAERMSNILFKESQRILVTPNSLDLPLWADNETARAYLQFKSFSFASHNQITMPMIERAKVGDMQVMLSLGFMATNGLGVEFIKLLEADRLDELDDYAVGDWALAMADRSSIIPLVMMGFNDLDLAVGNALTEDLFQAMPTSRVSDRSRLGIFGPTASTIGDLLRASAALTGQGGPEAKDARAMRRLIPFNNLAGVNRLAKEAEGWIAPQQPRRSKKKKQRDTIAERY